MNELKGNIDTMGATIILAFADKNSRQKTECESTFSSGMDYAKPLHLGLL